MPVSSLQYNSIFETSEWLDIVAKESWKRIEITKKDGSVEASFPVYLERKYGCQVLSVPPLTPFLGIAIEETGAKLSKQLEKEKK